LAVFDDMCTASATRRWRVAANPQAEAAVSCFIDNAESNKEPLMRTERSRRRRTGFTMVEIIVVVIIISVLAALIVPKFIGRVGEARQSAAKQQIAEIEKAVDLFHYDYGRYPVTLDELVTRPSDIPEEKWKPPTLKSKHLIDPWDRPYQYRCPGDHGPVDLFSLGADGQEGGTSDNTDVVNW
jgi:general secretion pathway protein G